MKRGRDSGKEGRRGEKLIVNKRYETIEREIREAAYFLQFLFHKRPQMGYFRNSFANLGLYFDKMSSFG